MSQARTLADLGNTTADHAELSQLDGVTSTSAEINYLDITTLGTSQANKTVTADGSGNISLPGNVTIADGSYDFNIASHDGTNGLKLGGTLVTTSAADLNNSATTGKSIAMAIVFGGG